MHCTWSCLKTIVFPLNSTKKSPTVQYFVRACDIWQQTALASKSYVSHGKSMSVQGFVLMKIELCSVLPESSLPLLRVGVLVVYQREHYFPNIELFYFLQFMPVVKLVRLFEDLLISYLDRQKLSSQDGYQMRKSTSQNSKSTGIWLEDHRQVRALTDKPRF